MKSKILSAIVVLIAGFGVCFSQVNKEIVPDLVLANIEALAANDEAGKCGNPYDVYNHQLGFTQRTGRFTTNSNCEITLMGKKYKIAGAEANLSITVTYELGNCDKESPGNCCPNSRNGEINIISSK